MFLFIIFLSIGVLANAHEKCKVTEEACMVKLSNDIFSTMFSGSEELDPMRHEAIEGNLSVLKYRLSESSVTGFKNCKVDSAKPEFAKLTFDVTLLCPGFLMRGKYNINGRLFSLPVEGNGNFTIQTKKYRLKIHTDVEMEARDGKSYLNMKTFNIDAEPLEPVVFNLDNLFNGNKELAEPVLNYANANWIKVAKAVHGPVFQADIKKIIKAANKLLKENALEDYIIL